MLVQGSLSCERPRISERHRSTTAKTEKTAQTSIAPSWPYAVCSEWLSKCTTFRESPSGVGTQSMQSPSRQPAATRRYSALESFFPPWSSAEPPLPHSNKKTAEGLHNWLGPPL